MEVQDSFDKSWIILYLCVFIIIKLTRVHLVWVKCDKKISVFSFYSGVIFTLEMFSISGIVAKSLFQLGNQTYVYSTVGVAFF